MFNLHGTLLEDQNSNQIAAGSKRTSFLDFIARIWYLSFQVCDSLEKVHNTNTPLSPEAWGSLEDAVPRWPVQERL